QIVEPEVVTMPPTLTPGGGELVIPEAASGPYERPRRPYPEEEPEGAGFYDLICVHFHRTFIFSLQQMPITDGEKQSLAEANITDATMQKYLVWRRSIFLMVAIFSLIMALWSMIALILEPDPLAQLFEKEFKTSGVRLNGLAIMAKVLRILSQF